MVKSLTVDFDKMSQAISELTTVITQMEDVFKRVDMSLNMLRASRWSSPGKERFFGDYSDTWVTSYQKRLEQVEELKRNLEIAYQEYSELYVTIPHLADSLSI